MSLFIWFVFFHLEKQKIYGTGNEPGVAMTVGIGVHIVGLLSVVFLLFYILHVVTQIRLSFFKKKNPTLIYFSRSDYNSPGDSITCRI
jgi:hypothetical protein